VRLLIAHFLADFVLQSNAMVANKQWFSKGLLMHVAVLYVATALLSGCWILSLFITAVHYVIDGTKMSLQKKYPDGNGWLLFTSDQVLHLITLVLAWAYHVERFGALQQLVHHVLNHYHISLLALAYLLISTPAGYFIKYTLAATTSNKARGEISQDQERAGRFIGIFERIIILTLVLLQQYEAIGFLITGKSIIRFATHNEHVKSEYVLVGTMLSYCIAILTGVMVRFLM
jgi:hypothetical protein